MASTEAPSGAAPTAGAADGPEGHSEDELLHVAVINLAGERLASVSGRSRDTVRQLLAQLQERGSGCRCRLVWQGAVLDPDEELGRVGLTDGAAVQLVVWRPPGFVLASACVELLEEGVTARVREENMDAWGWATLCMDRGCRRLSVQLGPTASAQDNDTDYFLGAMLEEHFQAEAVENSLRDHGVALVLSTWSSFSGSISARGRGGRGSAFHERKFRPGDVVHVELDHQTGQLCFACDGLRSEPVDTGFAEFGQDVRLAASMYCRGSHAHGTRRSLTVVSAEYLP